ncbi:MAG TPA: EF-hand domain-containing protein [Methylotenera sp.]|nr:EF-hand domain-containing protein [Methylotenera sp.]HPH05848.1 EF-hand domain-containing protein [Methylotenera sp.]HPN00630.1 EF-hand domain-containing protein [Methylotenera sp.]
MTFQAVAGGRVNLLVAEGTAKQMADDDNVNDGLQQTLNLNFSPENREKLRRALDDYARSVDQNHDQIEESRRAMQESIERRFLDADSDGDGSVNRQEATEKLPQIARHFNQVDTNQDEAITIDELEDAQARILERRKAAELALQAKKLQDAVDAVAGKVKEKTVEKTIINTKKVRVN